MMKYRACGRRQKNDSENPAVYRQDYSGAWIRRDKSGNTESTLGWEIDHRKPVDKN
jgi:hypothetical protein